MSNFSFATLTSSAIFAGSPEPPTAFRASAAAFRAFSALAFPLLAPLYFSAGTEGTVVYIQDNGEAYTVEFFDENGDTIEDALFKDFLPSQLKKK